MASEKPTSDKVSEARRIVEDCFGGDVAAAYGDEILDNLIAAVRAEQPQAKSGYVNVEEPQASWNEHCELHCEAAHNPPCHCSCEDCGYPTCKKAEQPAAVGHVARCRCCIKAWPSPLTKEKRCVACGFSLSRPHPYTDPRCSPSLLREAEVRLEDAKAVHEQSICACPPGTVREAACLEWEEQARAEVERLRANT